MEEKTNESTYEKHQGGATLCNGKIVRIPATKDFIFKNLFGVQVKNENNIGERTTFYICKLYINSIGIGKKYNDINKTIAIAIIDFSYFNRK